MGQLGFGAGASGGAGTALVSRQAGRGWRVFAGVRSAAATRSPAHQAAFDKDYEVIAKITGQPLERLNVR